MPRAEAFKPMVILAGDLHCGDLHPECRSDNYLKALLQKVVWLAELQQKHKNIPILFPGDLFHTWSGGGTEAINALMEVWPTGPVFAVPGNHDLPQHLLKLQQKTAFQTMVLAGKIKDVSGKVVEVGDDTYLEGCAWGEEPREGMAGNVYNILMWHVTTWQQPFMPEQIAGDADRLLKKRPQFDLICTGDNHQTFTAEDHGNYLVNCGSVMRMTAAQIDHAPCVYLWAPDRPPKQVFIPTVPGVVSRAHVDLVNQREERTNAFVAKLEGGGEVSLSFQDNIETLLKEENSEVCAVVRECLNV